MLFQPWNRNWFYNSWSCHFGAMEARCNVLHSRHRIVLLENSFIEILRVKTDSKKVPVPTESVLNDPKDLNNAILRENYHMLTMEDIGTRLHGAKVCSVLDAKNGFCHVKLDEEPSHMTTFHTLFRHYRWNWKWNC